ncbi:Hypothetical protein AJAP_42860 (plasmid) [Amycolatopsis japonica]|uniref:HTH cro/C1-type domain-containing protein n=1 Tax=Amycolatopsis japonica TaxID=208439 RepID=A0A075V9Z1_9PSEU|nr:helix-turn-helix domain-containing protein [Amycolatopsis japonica]AIG81339.1 Hypothetical protein AJAP_42860 [Amycolatopsis japonica]
MSTRFDADGFHSALDTVRLARRMTWIDVARATGVSAAMLSRMKHGAAPAADGLAALCRWGRLDVADFLTGAESPADEPGQDPITVAMLAIGQDRSLNRAARTALTTVLLTTYQQLLAMTAAAKTDA